MTPRSAAEGQEVNSRMAEAVFAEHGISSRRKFPYNGSAISRLVGGS